LDDDPHTATARARPSDPGDQALSDRLDAWLKGDSETTLAGLISVFEEKSFALLFILLLGVSALPIPTGGATHVFDVIAIIVAAQLVAGRRTIWVPERWRNVQLAGGRRQRFIDALMKAIRFLERISRPRLRRAFDHRLSNSLFGLAVILLTLGAFVAPPFSGLDTLPALGVVLISLGVLLEDALLVAVGLLVGAGGVVLEVVLGKAAASGLGKLL
jgi:hypothetical protein